MSFCMREFDAIFIKKLDFTKQEVFQNILTSLLLKQCYTFETTGTS